MKAATCSKYGSTEFLKIEEVKKPIPKDNELLIKIHASTVTLGDTEIRSYKIPIAFRLFLRILLAIRNPKLILGQELAGEVESTGKNVTKFKVGDKVFAPTDIALGGHAEYRCLKESHPIALLPSNMNYGEAATLPTGGLNGLCFLRKAEVKSGDKVLINGAGGSIGTYSTQIAKAWDAEVTCIDSAEKLDMLKSIGADYVIDYKSEEFTENGKTYDAIIDIVGNLGINQVVNSLNTNGRFILGNPSLSQTFASKIKSLPDGKKAMAALADYTKEDVEFLKKMAEEGKIKAIIDKTYSLEEIAEAHEYVEAGLKKGNLVITI